MSNPAENKTGKKYRSLAVASIRRLILLALFIVLGTCGAAGVSLYHSQMQAYTDTAYSFLDFYASIIHLKQDLETNEPVLKRYIEGDGPDEEYYEFVMQMASGSAKAGFEDIYIVVPEENRVVYIIREQNFDASVDYSEAETAWIEKNWYRYSRPYEPGEKEIMQYKMTDPDEDSVLYPDLHQSRRGKLATALSPIFDYYGNAIALIGADIPLNRLYLQIAALWYYIILGSAIALAAAILIYYRLIRKQIIEPVVKLKDATGQIVKNISSGEEFSVDIHTGNEIEELADSFRKMDENLRNYISENTAILMEKQRISAELDLAAVIQQSMLENEFPPFPDRKEFDIYASMNPAREIGGDFYDFFFIDEDHLALVIADVSGKGIPAALFMMMCKLMIHNYTMTGMSPKDVMTKVNEELLEGNDAEMFVTIWLAILEVSTGKIITVNAGHENPVIKKPGGGFEEIVRKHSLAAGAVEGINYRENESQIDPGSVLFVYTDGLPEATDAENRLFGTERILRVLNENRESGPQEILQAMDRSVEAFVKEAPQFDDLTMLCIRYNGRQ
jgi:sigma-B regulation protein RsbU (phosphoserine phosphatase)